MSNASMSSSEATVSTEPPTTMVFLTTTTTSTTTTTPTTTTTSMYGSTQTATGNSETIIIASVLGGVAGAGLILLLVVCLVIRRRRRQRATKPPMLPDLSNQVVLTESQSTAYLVDNQFTAARGSLKPSSSEAESPTGGSSADSLPVAPPVPLIYEPPDLRDDFYENQENEPDIHGDYVAPSHWQSPETDDLYIAMDGGGKPLPDDVILQDPLPSHELVMNYALPSSYKPPACKGPPGYVNVPNSGNDNTSTGKINPNSENVNTNSENVNTNSESDNMKPGTVGTLPKYANLNMAACVEDEEDEMDYENVLEAKAKTKSPLPSENISEAKAKTKSPLPSKPKSSTQLMADILMKNCKSNGSPKQKHSPNKKTKPAHSKQNSSSSSASSTPKSKHKVPNPPSSDGAADYVNMKDINNKKGKR